MIQVINGVNAVGMIAKQKVIAVIAFWLIDEGAQNAHVIPVANSEITIANVIKKSSKNAIKRYFVNLKALLFSFANLLLKSLMKLIFM